MNKTLTMVIAYFLKYVKCIVIMLITAGITFILFEKIQFKLLVPVLFFELFAYSTICLIAKYIGRKKNPNFQKNWAKHELLLDELKQSDRYDDFKNSNALLSKANAFKNTYDLYKATFIGGNFLNADDFKVLFDSGELTNYIIHNPNIEMKYKNQLLRLYKDVGVNRASDTIIDEAKNGKNSISQRLIFTYIPYIVIGVIAFVVSIVTYFVFGLIYKYEIPMISLASIFVIFIVIYFEFNKKFETMLKSIVVMNNMIQYFFDRKKEIPQFSRDADSLIAFYERNKAE